MDSNRDGAGYRAPAIDHEATAHIIFSLQSSMMKERHSFLRSSAHKRIVAGIAIFSVRRRSKSADAWRRNAGIAVKITGGGGRANIGFLCNMPLDYAGLASDGGRREHDGSDQSSRQQLDRGH
jgi:hypothetical protein